MSINSAGVLPCVYNKETHKYSLILGQEIHQKNISNKWSDFGGKCNKTETFLEGAIREANEEMLEIFTKEEILSYVKRENTKHVIFKDQNYIYKMYIIFIDSDDKNYNKFLNLAYSFRHVLGEELFIKLKNTNDARSYYSWMKQNNEYNIILGYNTDTEKNTLLKKANVEKKDICIVNLDNIKYYLDYKKTIVTDNIMRSLILRDSFEYILTLINEKGVFNNVFNINQKTFEINVGDL